jgi:hypothetical protein
MAYGILAPANSTKRKVIGTQESNLPISHQTNAMDLYLALSILPSLSTASLSSIIIVYTFSQAKHQ